MEQKTGNSAAPNSAGNDAESQKKTCEEKEPNRDRNESCKNEEDQTSFLRKLMRRLCQQSLDISQLLSRSHVCTSRAVLRDLATSFDELTVPTLHSSPLTKMFYDKLPLEMVRIPSVLSPTSTNSPKVPQRSSSEQKQKEQATLSEVIQPEVLKDLNNWNVKSGSRPWHETLNVPARGYVPRGCELQRPSLTPFLTCLPATCPSTLLQTLRNHWKACDKDDVEDMLPKVSSKVTLTLPVLQRGHPHRFTGADVTPGHSQHNTWERESHATAGPSTPLLSTRGDGNSEPVAFSDREKESVEPSSSTDPEFLAIFHNGLSNYSSPVLHGGITDIFDLFPVQPQSESGGHSDVLVEVEAAVTAVSSSVTNTEPLLQTSSDPGHSQRVSSCLSRSHSVPSLSPSTSAENKISTRSQSLPDMLLKSSFEEFTPEVTVEEDDETYWFQCSCPGLYQCSVTGLVFHMEGEGDVVYRVVPWDRRLLAQHHKRPAGPLFDIKCLQQSVCRLHLPHCEISSTAGCHFLSVAHVKDDDIEFIAPHKTTETHVVINITGFSGFGNVKDEDSPPEPVLALVLLFYRPLNDLTSQLNVLVVPRNVVLRDVLRTRKKLCRDEIYLETSSRCKLQPAQEYTLSTCPEDDSVLVQPTEAEFDDESYDNYIPAFEVRLKTILLNLKLFLRDPNSSHSVWEREVCLPSAGGERSCVQGSSEKILLDIRSGFIDGISGPVLNSLLDKLLEMKVMSDSERESADVMQNKRDKARFVIDTVRKKGEAASSEMIEFLCEVDPFLCENLGLS